MRRRRGVGERLVLLEEAGDAYTLSLYGFMLGADHTAAAYRRLVELVGELGMPSPPPVGELGVFGESWARSAGLLHPMGRCRTDLGEHWAFMCRG